MRLTEGPGRLFGFLRRARGGMSRTAHRGGGHLVLGIRGIFLARKVGGATFQCLELPRSP